MNVRPLHRTLRETKQNTQPGFATWLVGFQLEQPGGLRGRLDRSCDHGEAKSGFGSNAVMKVRPLHRTLRKTKQKTRLGLATGFV